MLLTWEFGFCFVQSLATICLRAELVIKIFYTRFKRVGQYICLLISEKYSFSCVENPITLISQNLVSYFFFFLFILCVFNIIFLDPIHFPYPSHLPSLPCTPTQNRDSLSALMTTNLLIFYSNTLYLLLHADGSTDVNVLHCLSFAMHLSNREKIIPVLLNLTWKVFLDIFKW